MTFGPGARKLALTAHVASSVGWLGAVLGFLALAIAGLFADDAPTARAAYVAMRVVTWAVIVPLGFAALITGIVQSLGTAWGLVRHYWVIVKLVLTVIATALLLLHAQAVDFMAQVAADSSVVDAGYRRVQVQLVADAGAAVLLLLATTALSIYKPRGMTAYGQRRQYVERAAASR